MSDLRRRNLIVLGVAAAVSVALAAFALEQRAAEGAPHYRRTEFLPGFAGRVKDAARIHVVGHDGAFDVSYSADKGWVLPGRGNYPADFDSVQHTLIGLATLEAMEPRTKRPDWLHYLGLAMPPAGDGASITVSDARGAVLASVIVGHVQDNSESEGTKGVFVRRPGEDQSWLARTAFVPHGDIASWMMAAVMSVSAERLQSIAVTPATGQAFTLARVKPGADYAIASAPKNLVLDQTGANDLAGAISGFTFADVRPDTGLDFSAAGHVLARTFDGLAVRMDILRQDADIWVRISAMAVPGAAPTIAAEASRIAAHAGGWAYKLPQQKGAALSGDLSKLLTTPQGMMPGMGAMP